jgi:hypothetical protein
MNTLQISGITNYIINTMGDARGFDMSALQAAELQVHCFIQSGAILIKPYSRFAFAMRDRLWF